MQLLDTSYLLNQKNSSYIHIKKESTQKYPHPLPISSIVSDLSNGRVHGLKQYCANLQSTRFLTVSIHLVIWLYRLQVCIKVMLLTTYIIGTVIRCLSVHRSSILTCRCWLLANQKRFCQDDRIISCHLGALHQNLLSLWTKFKHCRYHSYRRTSLFRSRKA